MITDFRDPLDIARSLWKYKLWIATPLVLGIAASQVALRMVTPIYTASTLVMIEPQKVPSSYVQSTVTSSLQDRLKTLEQQVKKRSTMEKLVEDAQLYTKNRPLVPIEELVSWARRSLNLRVERGQLVRIEFSSTDPAEAARAANGVADLFIAENLDLREKQAENTTVFLEEELAKTKQQLEEQETKVSEFRLRNSGSLPTQREANLASIAQFERLLDQNRAETEDAELRRFLLMREEDPATGVVAVAPDAKKARLEQLELELQRLKAQFTDRHPDVVRLQAEIDRLRAQQRFDSSSEPAPVEVDQPRDEVDLEITNLGVELNRLEREREKLMQQIEVYRRRLEAMPKVEQELLNLTRDYDNMRGSYEDLLSKLIEARLAEELERKQQSEQFKVLEEASAPSYPSYPNSFVFNLMGLLIGGGAGIGLALVRDYFDDTFTDESTLMKAFPGVGTVISIPHLDDELLQEGDSATEGEQKAA